MTSPRRILIIVDSILKPLEHLLWPSPYKVLVRCLSGAGLRAAVLKSQVYSASSFDVIVLHAGVNDASCGSGSFEDEFRASCESPVWRCVLISGNELVVSLA